MALSTDNMNDVTVVRLTGECGSEDWASLSETLEQALEDGSTAAVIDMSDLAMLDSSGLSAMIQTVIKARTRNADVVLAGPTPFVKGVLEVTRLDSFFVIYENLDSALKAVRD